jgi:hypothetical protein
LGGIERGEYFLVCRLTQGIVYLGDMGARSLVLSQGMKVVLKNKIKFKELFLWWCGMGWLEKGGWIYSFFSFII